MAGTIETQLRQLVEKQTGFIAQAESKFKNLQMQVDCLDSQVQGGSRHVGGSGQKSIAKILEENESVSRLLFDKKGTAVITLKGAEAELLERKTNITSAAVGSMTSGVLQIDRTPGITPEARQKLMVRDLLTSRPTQMQIVDFVKVATPMAIASPQTEASAAAENAVTFTTASEKVQTIATWIPATKQILDDFAELAGFVDTTLRYYLDLAEEVELLSGDGTGTHLHGLITQATAFNTALLSNSRGWNKIDIVGRAIEQLAIAKELTPTFIVLNPADWSDMRLTKDSYGRYLLGDPQTAVPPSLFNKPVSATTSIASGTFLVGCGDPVACEIRDRLETQVEVSTGYSDYFVRGMVAVRAEKRLCLVTKRPAAFIYGQFTSSPA